MMPDEFEVYIKRGKIRKCSIDKPRAEFLIEEAKNSLDGLKERIEKIGITDIIIMATPIQQTNLTATSKAG